MNSRVGGIAVALFLGTLAACRTTPPSSDAGSAPRAALTLPPVQTLSWELKESQFEWTEQASVTLRKEGSDYRFQTKCGYPRQPEIELTREGIVSAERMQTFVDTAQRYALVTESPPQCRGGGGSGPIRPYSYATQLHFNGGESAGGITIMKGLGSRCWSEGRRYLDLETDATHDHMKVLDEAFRPLWDDTQVEPCISDLVAKARASVPRGLASAPKANHLHMQHEANEIELNRAGDQFITSTSCHSFDGKPIDANASVSGTLSAATVDRFLRLVSVRTLGEEQMLSPKAPKYPKRETSGYYLPTAITVSGSDGSSTFISRETWESSPFAWRANQAFLNSDPGVAKGERWPQPSIDRAFNEIVSSIKMFSCKKTP